MNCGNYRGINLMHGPETSYDRYESLGLLVHERQGVKEKFTRLAKNVYHQCETVVRCGAGTSEPFAVEVNRQKGSTFSPFVLPWWWIH